LRRRPRRPAPRHHGRALRSTHARHRHCAAVRSWTGNRAARHDPRSAGAARRHFMTDRATRDWNTLGETQPYFAVLTHDRFLCERMSAADREAFFAFGEADIAQIFDLIDIAP